MGGSRERVQSRSRKACNHQLKHRSGAALLRHRVEALGGLRALCCCFEALRRHGQVEGPTASSSRRCSSRRSIVAWADWHSPLEGPWRATPECPGEAFHQGSGARDRASVEATSPLARAVAASSSRGDTSCGTEPAAATAGEPSCGPCRQAAPQRIANQGPVRLSSGPGGRGQSDHEVVSLQCHTPCRHRGSGRRLLVVHPRDCQCLEHPHGHHARCHCKPPVERQITGSPSPPRGPVTDRGLGGGRGKLVWSSRSRRSQPLH